MKEGHVLFNDALNIGVRHMIKDHSDSEKGNPLPPHRLLFPISSKGYFICTIPQAGKHNTYSREALAGTRNSSMGSTMKDRSDDPSHQERTLLPRSYISLAYIIMNLITYTKH